MGIERLARAACLGLLCIIASGPRIAAAEDTSGSTHTKPQARPKAAHAAGAAASSPGFTIAPTPAWVQPLAYDPAAPIASASYQILLSDEQTRVQDGGSVRYRRYMRRINDSSALQQGGQIEVEFDPSYQRLVFHKIEILRGSQRIDKLDAKKIRLLQREQQLERQVIDGRMTASLVLDDLRAGDRVEWAVSIIGDNPVFGGRFVDAIWTAYPSGPMGQWQLRVLAPAARDIHTRVGDAAIQSTSTVHDGLRETVFRRGNVAQLQVDGHVPAAEYLKLQVELSEFSDWKDVAAWAAKLFAGAMQTSPAVDAQVDTLKAQAADREALLRATLDFVQRDIRYFGTESGIASHQPATADAVLRQRFGDCKDKVALLAELLTRLGFDATPVIVSATYQDATRQRLPSPLAFDHAIVRVTIDGKPVFLDATRSQQTGRIATRESLDLGVGLLAQDAASDLSTLPSSRDQVHVETVDTFAFPQLAKEGTLTSVTILRGDTAEWFRSALASQPRSEIEKGITGESVRAYPSLVAVGPVDFETITEDNSVRITSHYRTGDFWTMPEQRALVGRFVLYALVGPLRLQDQATRSQPYRLPRGRYLHKAVFEFGEPFPGAPQDVRFDEANDFFELHTHAVAQSPREEMDGELDMLADAVPAADWPAHRDKVNKVAPHLGGSIAMSPYSVAQFEALRGEGEALLTRLRKGDIKTVTQVQVGAHLKLLADEHQLDSDRLPPTLRAQVLVDKGEQLDHLGRMEPAAEAFDAAIGLDPKNASAHEALAINAMLRGDDAKALAEADEALRLSPSLKTRLDITRGYAHYLGGDANAARDDFKAALQSRAEVERSYGAIWLYLATRRAGDDGVQAVKAFEPAGAHPDWPFSVLQLMEGRIDLDAALLASRENGQRSPSRECELYFYAGEKAWVEGDLDKARKYLRMSVATGVTEFNEYQAARLELARLGDR